MFVVIVEANTEAVAVSMLRGVKVVVLREFVWRTIAKEKSLRDRSEADCSVE
jgi:hypothetical protein